MNAHQIPQSQVGAIRFFADAENCHNFLSSLRWPSGVCCGHCQSPDIGALVVTATKSRSKREGAKPITRRLWNCKACSKQFTAKTGTIFEDSALGLESWLPAVWMICNAKNGISSCELARSLEVTQKTAWFMGHRIRLAMQSGNFMASGEVEADETFIGGTFRNMAKGERARRLEIEVKTGKLPKVPVHGVLERSPEKGKSRVLLSVLPNTRKEPIMGAMRARVRPGSKVFTDALNSYRQLTGSEFDHEFIDHTISYARGKVHTNGMENFWALLKRTLGGTYVQVSPEHLFRYLNEQATRFNERSENDLGRFLSSMKRVIGRRITWDELVSAGAARRPA